METRGLILQGHRVPSSTLRISSNGALLRNVWMSGGTNLGTRIRTRALKLHVNHGRRRALVVRCNESDEVDMPVEAPAYTSYTDPNTGEPSPTYGARTPLPGPAFWGEDMQRVVRSAQASTPRSETKNKSARSSHVSKRKSASVARREAENARVPNEFEEDEEVEEEEEEFVPLTKEQIAATGKEMIAASGDQMWYTKNDIEHDPIKEALHQMEEEHEEEMAQEEVQEDEPEVLVSKEDEALAPTLGETEQLSNSELWWNWRKPEKDKEPWSAWHKRSGDSDSVMAAAMAKSGQIKLFGEKPTIAEASLARARKRVFYEERMREEEARRKKVGSMAYYQEWVKEWRQDTSKASVKEKEKKTGQGVVDQLMDMVQHQTLFEYRQMQGTDIRIRRDPLTMRLSEEEVKAVWGGDPVYPTINYVQDPDCVADFRNANMHEPTPDILEQLRDDNRLITTEELQELLAREEMEAREQEGGSFDDGMTGAIDIGDGEDEDDDDEDEDEVEDEDDNTIRDDVAAWRANNQELLSSAKPKPKKPQPKHSSEVPDLLDQIDTDDLVEYVGPDEGDEEEEEEEEEDYEDEEEDDEYLEELQN